MHSAGSSDGIATSSQLGGFKACDSKTDQKASGTIPNLSAVVEGFLFWFFFINCAVSHLLSHADAAAAQRIDVVMAAVHEAADEPVVTEDDGGHLGDVLLAVVVADVPTVVHQAGHQVALAQLLGGTFFNLSEEQRTPTQRTSARHAITQNLAGYMSKFWVLPVFKKMVCAIIYYWFLFPIWCRLSSLAQTVTRGL